MGERSDLLPTWRRRQYFKHAAPLSFSLMVYLYTVFLCTRESKNANAINFSVSSKQSHSSAWETRIVCCRYWTELHHNWTGQSSHYWTQLDHHCTDESFYYWTELPKQNHAKKKKRKEKKMCSTSWSKSLWRVNPHQSPRLYYIPVYTPKCFREVYQFGLVLRFYEWFVKIYEI